jgi:hypothetical protein
VPDTSSPQTQTLACPAGQTGAITQIRTSSCGSGVTPTWSTWATTNNTCTVVDACFSWPNATGASMSLQQAVTANACVTILPGSYTLDADVVIPSNHTLKGAGANNTILKANPQKWKFGYADALLTHAGVTSNVSISDLTLDASGIATYGIVADEMTIDRVAISNGRCSAVALNGSGIILRNSTLDRSGQTTTIAGRGTFNCASVPDGATSTPGVALGAAIYGEGYVGNRNFAPDIENNIIKNSIGPGVDINNVDGGIFANNTVSGNSGWAGVSLYETTGWQILNNHISHPSSEPAQPYHLACAGGPNGPRSVGIFLCSDTEGLGGAAPAPSTKNRISGNESSSFNGILLIGAGTASNPSLSPFGNYIENNNVFGSVGPCGDNFNPSWATASIPGNTWTGNNCSGLANTPPYQF